MTATDRPKTAMVLVIALLMIAAASLVQAGGFTFSGYAKGDCYSGADVNISVYDNTTKALLNSTLIAAAADGLILTGLNAPNNIDCEINITATKAACSPGAIGITTRYANSGNLVPIGVNANVTIAAPFSNNVPGNGTPVGNNLTPHDWNSDYLGVNFTLEIATTSAFGGTIVFSRSVVPSDYTIQAGEELANGVYFWRVRAVNGSGNTIDTTAWYTYTLTSGAPVISNPVQPNSTWFNGSPQNVTITTDINAVCKWDNNPLTPFAAKTLFDTTGGTTHTVELVLGSEGANNYYFQCNNSVTGTTTLDYNYVMNRDTTAPTPGTVSIEGGAAYSNDTTIDFTWVGFTDGGAGIVTYYYAFVDNGGTAGGMTNTSPNSGQLTGASQGGVTVYVWARDDVGNIGAAASDGITVDSLPPSFSGWFTTPADLTKYSTGGFMVSVTVSDTSSLAAAPTIRHRIGSDAWSGLVAMTLWATAGNTWEYRYTIPEQASPNTWFERNGENLTYQVAVTDTRGFSNNVTRNEYINAQSTAPVFSPIPNQVVEQDNTTQFNLTGSDVDLNTLTYTCDIPRATITQLTDTISRVTWTPTNDEVGSAIYTCNVTDGTFTVSQTVNITVVNVNDDPVLQPIGDLYAQEYEFFNYTLNASDPDNDTIMYASNASIFSINRLNGKIAFTPFSTDRGTYSINVSVSDGLGGSDYEEILFTIGYCGDDVCRQEYESCTSCEIDCGVCGEEEKKAIIVEPRNCLDELMTMQAVTLVTRATCEVEGAIIDGMEVCGNESSTTLRVFILVDDDTWEEVTQVVTDEDGFASFTPDEEGEYKASYANDQEAYTLFEIETCLGGKPESTTTITPAKPKPSEPVLPPILEEPTLDQVKSKWSFFSVLLYFFIIPLLLIALVISTLGYIYREERRKGRKTQFVKQMETWHKEWSDLRRKALVWMQKTPPFNEMLKQWLLARKELRKTLLFIRRLAVEYWYQFVIAIGLQRRIRLQYYPMDAPGKKLHLLLISLLKNLFPERPVDELLAMIHQYDIKGVLDLAAMLLSFGVRPTYIDPQPANIQYLNALIGKGLTFKSRPTTRVDFESALLDGRPVVCLVNELGERGTVVQSLVILYAFDKQHFYYHDYVHDRQGLRATKDQFMHAWTSAGQQALFMRK